MERSAKDGKVAAAVSAAVFSYLAAEKKSEKEKEFAGRARPASLWAVFGRQEQMNLRTYSNLRMIRR